MGLRLNSLYATLVIPMCCLSASFAAQPNERDLSVFDSIQLSNETLVIRLRTNSGLRLWILPDSLPLTPHEIKAGEPLRVPSGVTVQLYERHHGVKMSPLTNLSNQVGYQIEFYQDTRSAGGKLDKVRKFALAGPETKGSRVLEIQPEDAAFTPTTSKTRGEDLVDKAAPTDAVEQQLRPSVESNSKPKPSPETSPTLKSKNRIIWIIGGLGILLLATATLLLKHFKRRKT
jgi:hypothetical protein